MRLQVGLIPRRNDFKKNLKLYLPVALSLYYVAGEQAKGDSTFFPDDELRATTDKSNKESWDAMKEWAELKPSKRESTKLMPLQKKETKKVSLSPPTETPAIQKQEPISTVSTETDTKTPPLTEEQKPLQLAKVEAHPKVLPVQDSDQTSSVPTKQTTSKKKVISYSDAANDRSPLGIVDSTQEVQSQRWYIYSSAIRGLKNPSDSVHVVSMEGTPENRGEEVKNLLVDMGVEPEKIQLIHAKGEEGQAGIIYIFAGK